MNRRTAFKLPLVIAVGLVALAAGLPKPRVTAQDGDAALLEKLRYPKTIVLVRHAEKSIDDARDPNLSEAGVARAQELARVLGDAGVTHLFSSEYKRTRQTLEPLSLVSGAAVQVVPAREPGALVSALAQLPRNSVAVVAGHSNTVPGLVRNLAGADPFTLSDEDYDHLYVVTRTADDGPATLLKLHFGAR
jgi:broad specificity phosphatase PhoE